MAAFAAPGRVLLPGLSGEPLSNARALLEITELECDAPRWRVQRAFRLGPRQINQALRALGYYAPVVKPRLSFAEGCWEARFEVDPGPPVVVALMDVQLIGAAAGDPVFRDLLRNLPLAQGEVLHHGRYEDSKRALQNLGAERGYFDARFAAARIEVDPDADIARVVLHYDSGPRYRFGEVQVSHEILEPAFVARYVDIREGEPYDSARLSSLYQGLADSGYFGDVRVRPSIEAGAGEAQVPVDVELVARARYTHSFGIGIATDTGPRVSYGYNDRRITETGHQVNASVSVSAVGDEFGGEYRIPAKDPRNEWYSLHAARKAERTDTAESSRLVAGVRRTRKRGRWLETLSLEQQRETFTVAEQTETTNILMPGISWSRSRSDNPTYPRSGYRANLEVRGGSQDLFSDVSFAQVIARGKRIFPLPFNSRVLLRLDLGVTELERLAELPASLRFFAGGDNSVRGYAYQSLGPEDDDGDVVGGRHLLVGSVEVEWPFAANWSIAGFVDQGNAIDNLSDELQTGAGLGFRWRSPIGPIRIDLAHPLDDPDTNVRLHLSMGLDL